MSNSIGRWFARLSESGVEQVLRRFALSSLQVVLLVALLCISVSDYKMGYERWWEVAVYYLSSGAVLSWGLQMYTERGASRARLTAILVQLLWLGNALYLYFATELDFGLILANLSMLSFIAVCSLIAPSMGTKNELPTWNYTLRTLATIAISGLIALFLTAGICLLFLMLELLFKVPIEESKVYGYIWVIVPLLTFTYLFLSQQARGEELVDEEVRTLGILNIFARYLLAPLLVVYLVVLYLYALRILVLWELPNGWVSYPIAALLGGTILLGVLLYPARQEGERRPYDELCCRWLPLFVLPLLILMSVGLARRWSDYGMTVMRLYLLAFNVWSYFACIYLFVHRSQRLRLLPLSLSIIFVLSSIGPWSFSSITYRYMRSGLEQLLADAKQKPKLPMSQEALNSFISSLAEEERLAFVSKLEYLDDTYSRESIKDLIDDRVPLYGITEANSLITEDWRVELADGFIPLPQGFGAFSEKYLYINWTEDDFKRGQYLYEDEELKLKVIISLEELREWKNAKPYRPHLFSTSDPNIFYYATSTDLSVVKDKQGKMTEANGSISGLYLRK